MTEAQTFNATELLVCLGVLLAAFAAVACKLKWGDHVNREERRYRATRRFAAFWAYVLMAGAAVLLALGVLGVIAGDAGGWAYLLVAVLFVVGSRISFWVVRRRRPKWLEIALDRRQRDRH